jgi:hypothetical protein
MPETLRCRHLPQDDLVSGRWHAAVMALLAQEPPPREASTDGAAAAAAAILRLLADPTPRYTWRRSPHE